MVALFQDAYAAYVRGHPSRGDRPCCFLSYNGSRFNTNSPNEPGQLPRGLVTAGKLFGLV